MVTIYKKDTNPNTLNENRKNGFLVSIYDDAKGLIHMRLYLKDGFSFVSHPDIVNFGMGLILTLK